MVLSKGKESLKKSNVRQNYIDWLQTEADISGLPENIQLALQLLNNEGLEAVGQAALPNTQIYSGIVEYFKSSWNSCDWIDNLPGKVELDVFTWEQADNVVQDGGIAYCEFLETFHPFTMDDIDASTPAELQTEIQNLLEHGGQCIARFKYQAWIEYGIIWNAEFVSQLGLNDDSELFSEFDTQLDSVLGINTETNDVRADKTRRLQTGSECSIENPLKLMAPYFRSIAQVWGDIFGNNALNDSSICASISWGAQVGVQDEVAIASLGGSFGVLACANGEGLILQESKLNINEDDTSTLTDALPKLTIEMSIYNNIDDAIGGKLTKLVVDSEADQWLAQPRIIYDENNNCIGVTFAGEVAIDVGITSVGDALGSGYVFELARFSFGDDDLRLFGQHFGYNNVIINKKKNVNVNGHNYIRYLLIGGLIMFGILIILIIIKIKKTYYSNKLNEKSHDFIGLYRSIYADSERDPLLT